MNSMPNHRAPFTGPVSLTGAVFLAGLGAWALASSAQAAPPEASLPPGATLLHLSATGTVQEAPDLLVAQLAAEATSADPVVAQKQVNRLIAAATAMAAKMEGVVPHLADYSVEHSGEKQQLWTARQMLRLQATDGTALLELVGRLQGSGLVIGDLAWTLSPARMEEAERLAADKALKTLQANAAAAARSLGLKVGTIRDVSLSGGGGEPRPMMRMKAMVMSAPEATQDAQGVSREASAEIELDPMPGSAAPTP
ncbi:SIMPL domain-containing protein [Lichenicola cladoniae]|uniref:SIMPL domain-containing protein n=1 Tax=Lichenicola cladoniae TaxID=1484109 RepID=A0A6M8HTB2_9PROT|nr:SIMPL domain-containing protein [Lichenicola cladoniae]NPD65339.1 SIMPL domain-containing protein [Acetobacteraceae bacterium]QKE91572.1 SIMPL domain-containing protein [Lichenicola cladoniae]